MIDFGKIQGLTDRSLIESIVCGFFIVDYGFINKVNADKTVNVTHAKKQVLLDGTELPILETPNLEVLTISGSGFSLNFDYKAGDKVLLLGLKDYVEKVKDVNEAKTPETFIHYNRSTLKVLPLCVFNSEAKVKIEIEKGKFSLESEKECVINSSKIELNGNDNNFVTWKELNQSLQNFLTLLNAHTHSNGNLGNPTGNPIAPMQLDISSSKTKTIFTGG